MAFTALVILLAPFGPCTERGALQSRFAGSAHDTATPDLPTLISSWQRHLAAQHMSQATLATYSASVLALVLGFFAVPRAASVLEALGRRRRAVALLGDPAVRGVPQ